MIAWLLVAGCAGPATPDPSAARLALSRALVAGDEVTLARLAGDEPNVLAPHVAEARRELAELGEELANVHGEERAHVYVDAHALVLVLEDGVWRIDRGILGAPVLETPADALGAFGRALRAVPRDELGAVLGRRARSLVLDELSRWARGLSDPAAVPIVVDADHATATLPTGVIVELVREAGEWRVDDVHE